MVPILPCMNQVVSPDRPRTGRACPSLGHQAREAAAALVAELDGVAAVLIATPDGLELACAGKRPLEARRLAAMAVGLASLGDGAAAAGRAGPARQLVVEAGSARIVVQRLRLCGADLVALLIAEPGLSLGLAAGRLRALGTAG